MITSLLLAVAALAVPIASSAATTGPETRVWGSTLPVHDRVGEEAFQGLEPHQESTTCGCETVVGFLVVPKPGTMEIGQAAGGGARFIGRTGGEVLDVTKIRVPGARNSPFGKVDYLLGNVPSVESVGKGGFFRGVLGFEEGSLGPALERHLVENFEKAAVEGSRIRVVGTLVGPGGRAATVQSVWQITPEGFVDLITAVPR